MPFHFIRWAKPTQILKVNIENNSCEIFYDSEPYRLLMNWSELVVASSGWTILVHILRQFPVVQYRVFQGGITYLRKWRRNSRSLEMERCWS